MTRSTTGDPNARALPLGCRYRDLRALSLLLGLLVPAGGSGQQAARADVPVSIAEVPSGAAHPSIRTSRELLLAGLGAGLFGSSSLVQGHVEGVPSLGLNPATITWPADREAVGRLSAGADGAANWTRDGALAFPLVLALATGFDAPGGRDLGRRGLMYAEAYLLSQGLTRIGKATLSRARPYAYVPELDRPAGPSYDVLQERTFRSMPSGHSSSAWTGVAFGLTEHLLRRPNAGWVERAGVGFVGGALAGATSALRVEAGQHFPSDVLVGAGIGIASGVTIPILHRGDQPLPSTGGWLTTLGGTFAGALVGITVARAAY